MSDLLKRVLEHEGFREKPYQDTLGVWTIGHGLTWLSEEESARIVADRLAEIRSDLLAAHPWLSERHNELIDVLTEMAFQLGWSGLHQFKRMWAALRDGDYVTAAAEGLDSRWAKQTPNRANELMDIVKCLTHSSP